MLLILLSRWLSSIVHDGDSEFLRQRKDLTYALTSAKECKIVKESQFHLTGMPRYALRSLRWCRRWVTRSFPVASFSSSSFHLRPTDLCLDIQKKHRLITRQQECWFNENYAAVISDWNLSTMISFPLDLNLKTSSDHVTTSWFQYPSL